MRPLIPVALAAQVLACGGTGGPLHVSGAPIAFSSQHFTLLATAADQASAPAMTAALEASYARILGDLQVDSMPTVTVTLYADHASLEAATRAIAGVVPAYASGLVTSETQIHMMSPAAPGWGPLDPMLTNLVHEFAHCVSLHVNPRFGNNPRWLWEAVAIFEARQSVDLRTVSYMASLSPPAFSTLNSFDNTRVYDVGYSIGEFIATRWGQASLRQLIAANGDTAAVLGLPLADFERDWFAFARQRYGL
jgi:hypothetical protein